MNQITQRIKEPLTIKKHLLQNRLVMPPMATAKSDELDHVSDEILAYYDEKTKSGHISLVIVEHAYVSKQGKASAKQISVSKDDDIPGLTKLATIIHANGSKAVMQISHAGNAAQIKHTSLPVVAPSPMVHPGTKQECQAMSLEEIQTTVHDFALAAGRAEAAGFDGIEIHGAHGYLLNQFYSPKTNLREDEYGGDVDNRIRFHLQVIEAIKSVVSKNFLVMMRLGACDYAKSGGSQITDGVVAAKAFEQAGIDMIDVTGGLRGYINPNSSQPGWFQDASVAIKQAVSIPVILTGGVTDIQQAEALLADGCADLIGVGRAILMDSDWPSKAFAK